MFYKGMEFGLFMKMYYSAFFFDDRLWIREMVLKEIKLIRKMKRKTVRKLMHHKTKVYINRKADQLDELIPINEYPTRHKYEPVPFQKLSIEKLEKHATGEEELTRVPTEKCPNPDIPKISTHNVNIEQQVEIC